MVRKHFEGQGPTGEPTTVQLILGGEIQLVINTPHGATSGGSARLDGYEIRTAAVRANIPCITTVQGLGAAVQGIEALQARRHRRAVAAGLGARGDRCTARCSTTASGGSTPRRRTTSASGRSAPARPVLGRRTHARASRSRRWG